MGSRWDFTVIHHDRDGSFPLTQDLTADTDTLPLFTDTSGGTINTAQIELNAVGGRYVKDGVDGKTIVDHNDRIRITMIDGVTVGAYDQVFEVVRRTPIKTKGKGTILRLEMEGIERHLQKIKYIKPHYFETPFNAFVDLVDYYNENRTDDMPELLIGTNELPKSGIHNFDWGVNEESVYNRIVELVDLMGSSGSAGGILDFFDFRFDYNGINVTELTINVFSSGDVNAGKPDVTVNATNVNTGETDGGIDEAEGTMIGAWGANATGTLPIEYSRFRSRQVIFPVVGSSLFPVYDNDVTYPPTSIVSFSDGVVYTNSSTTTGVTPPNSPWSSLTTAQYYGESTAGNFTDAPIEYSPWTHDKAVHWVNSGGDPKGTKGPFGPTMFDGNIIINDDETFRTWVDFRVSQAEPLLKSEWFYDNDTNNPGGAYDGLRVLVDTDFPAAPFDGTDSNGLTFKNNIAEFSSVDNDWRVKYNPDGDDTLDDMQVAVFDESRIYQWDFAAKDWEDGTSLQNGSDCFHPYDELIQTTSVHLNADTKAEFSNTNNGSGVKAVYTWQALDDWVQDTFNQRFGRDYFQAGAWLGLRFPFPRNDNALGAVDVGDIYGGGIQGTTIKEPSAVDAQNMHFTHNGFRGFNTDSADKFESLDYGQISSIDFFMKIIYFFTNTLGGELALPKGNFKMRCFLFDKSDHVVYQDFTVPFQNTYASISLPINGFQIYRGRRPRYLPFNIQDLIPPKGLAANEIFEYRHIVAMTCVTQESYDEQGRYIAGATGEFGIGIQQLLSALGIGGLLVNEVSRTLEIWMDGLRFGKPLLFVTEDVNSQPGEPLVKHPDFLQQPDVGNFEQLSNIAKTELEKAQFKMTQYDLQTEIRRDVRYGDFFLFEDDEIVEDDVATDTVKLVAKHIDYSITKPVKGSGGGLRRIRGSRRFV